MSCAASCRVTTGVRYGHQGRGGARRPAADRAPHGIRLPRAFALVGKTLSQADSIARLLDPEMTRSKLLDDDATQVMLEEAERQLEPSALLAYLFTQLDAVSRLPRRIANVVDHIEEGTIKVGVVPTGSPKQKTCSAPSRTASARR